jgi:uncharacterized damage-inducible protein DinB
MSRQSFLIEQNIASLRQAVTTLEQIDDLTYRTCPPSLAPHRVGGHLRHILEFYECFLDGLETSHIDYDARKRDETVEMRREMALDRIRSVIERLEQARELRSDPIIWVRVEDAQSGQLDDSYMTSSVGRELQALSSHTIHHFALIAMTLRALGVQVDRDFGTAPSTLRYRATQETASEAA